MLDGPPLSDTADGTTTIKLTNPLQNQYDARGTVMMANVVAVTQGETVRDEALGNGTGAPFQSFVLKKSPLTFLPTTDAAGVTAVADTLTVTVNGVRWTEVANLIGSAPNAQSPSPTHRRSAADDSLDSETSQRRTTSDGHRQYPRALSPRTWHFGQCARRGDSAAD